jgi:hypothetical protein
MNGNGNEWVWNWESIVVASGGWWLLLIGVLLAAIGFGVGWAAGAARERERLRRLYGYPPAAGGSSQIVP